MISLSYNSFLKKWKKTIPKAFPFEGKVARVSGSDEVETLHENTCPFPNITPHTFYLLND